MGEISFFPENASTMASRIDMMYFVLIGLSLAFAIPIAIAVIVFAIRYREGSEVDRSKPIYESLKIEFLWTFIPFVLAMGIFVWSAIVYFDYASPPKDTLDIYVIGKQWMWQIQHPLGKREINELHVPVNRPIKLIMTSQDVIHSFFVPAFRVKQDVLPGRYTTLWFEPTKVGEYHLFCAEYCGTDHSRMTGKVIVMEQAAYEEWLGGPATGTETMAEAGERLFEQQACGSCHTETENARAPSLVGRFGGMTALQGGQTVPFDEAYVRESLLQPEAKLVAGYDAIMPSYEGSISEEGILQLIAYLKAREGGQSQ